MKFQHGQKVFIKSTKRYGTIAGFCHYNHPNDTWAETNSVIHEGAIVDLARPYVDRGVIVRMVVIPINQLREADRNEGWGDSRKKDELPYNPLYRHMTKKVR